MNKQRKLPTVSDFLLNVPLYKVYAFNKEDYRELSELRNYEGPLDCQCLGCSSKSVFKERKGYKSYEEHYALQSGVFKVNLTCSRDSTHYLDFYFLVNGLSIQKIGQYPSLADLEQVEIEKYRGILDKHLYTEFSKAIGLSSHGIGIGSFVYLRRIFENLVYSAFNSLEAESVTREDFERMRMDEKIKLLKDHLPSFLVQNRSIYSILSKGIHSLTEQETLEVFPAIKLGIELILDEKLEQDEKQKKIEEAEHQISIINQKIKNA